MAGATAAQLLEMHTDRLWRKRFVDITDLMDILRDCIIGDEYTIPDGLNEAIALTDQGNSLKSRLIRKEDVPAKEAHLMCALSTGHDELFIDIEHTDIDGLMKSISEQIRDAQIRFPFIYHRALYDAFADQFEDEKDSLSTEETVKLLDGIPRGVFQYGRFVVGPSGVSKSKYSRSLRFSKRVPAYHCSDPVCRELHSVFLSTSYKAEINAQRQKLVQVLESMQQPEADWSGLALELSDVGGGYFGNHWIAPMIALLGDALSDDELKHMITALGNKEVPEERAELLQLSLFESDQDLAACLDRLVLTHEIRVPMGEIRRPVSTAHLRSGAYRLQPQLGARGVRFVSGDPGLATLRERELVKRVYLTGNEDDRHELDWQLRGVDGVSLERRLDDFLRTQSPQEALTRLVLTRSSSAIAASEVVGIGEVDGISDSDLIAQLAWKLGFDTDEADDAHANFWGLHEKLTATVQSWLGTGSGDTNDFRGRASSYFTELEGLLESSLAFSSWVLLRDHISAARPFSYDNEGDRLEGFSLLQAAYSEWVEKRPRETLKFTGRKTMYVLVRGFEVLAEALNSLRAQTGQHVRPTADYPEFAARSSLQRFPFHSEIPFLDLAEHSMERIIGGLREVAATLNSDVLPKARNEYSHYRRTSPEVALMEGTLEAVGRAVRLIENLGFGLNLCRRASETSDRWGRRSVVYVGPRSTKHVFARPSSLEWLGLPSLRGAQFLVRAAAFDDANEVLRFEPRYVSKFAEMWGAYPKPRKKAPPAADGTSGGFNDGVASGTVS